MSTENPNRVRFEPEDTIQSGRGCEDPTLPPHSAVVPLSDYDFWLFDLDGTLIDVESKYVRTLFDRIGHHLDHHFTDTQADILWYGIGNQRETCLKQLGIDVDQFWTAFHRVEDPSDRASATYLYQDADIITSIPTPVGIVTHCQRYLTEPVLEELDILDWFDVVLCCSDEIGWKPNPEPVERAIAELGVREVAQTGVLVGDDPYDTGAAWNAGLDSIHIERSNPTQHGQSVLGNHRVSSLRAISDD